jgi:hypothetical protein
VESDHIEDPGVYERKNNIKTDFKDMGLEGVDWIHLAQDRVRWWLL